MTQDITKKISKVSHAHDNALSRLENFHAERERLIKYIDELDAWLGSKENTLKTIEKTLRVENIGKCKEVNIELLTQRENIEQTKDHLNSLCRQYHASDQLNDLTDSVTNLFKKYESVCRLSVKVLQKLEGHLTEQYNESQEKFLIWKKQAQETVSSCQDVSGRVITIKQINLKQATMHCWRFANNRVYVERQNCRIMPNLYYKISRHFMVFVLI